MGIKSNCFNRFLIISFLYPYDQKGLINRLLENGCLISNVSADGNSKRDVQTKDYANLSIDLLLYNM